MSFESLFIQTIRSREQRMLARGLSPDHAARVAMRHHRKREAIQKAREARARGAIAADATPIDIAEARLTDSARRRKAAIAQHYARWLERNVAMAIRDGISVKNIARRLEVRQADVRAIIARLNA